MAEYFITIREALYRVLYGELVAAGVPEFSGGKLVIGGRQFDVDFRSFQDYRKRRQALPLEREARDSKDRSVRIQAFYPAGSKGHFYVREKKRSASRLGFGY